MSIITRNQITIINLNDGDPGPQGPAGDTGATGPAGQTMYTWVAFASDGNGSDISLTYNSGVHTHIGRRYNMTSQTANISEPSAYDWTPFYANLIGEDIEIIEGGAIRAGYDAEGNEPSSGVGFFLGSDGILRAVGVQVSGQVQASSGVFQNSIVYGQIIHDTLETVEQQSGTTISAVSTSLSLWAESAFYSGFNVTDSATLQAITAASWGGKTPTHATKRNNSRITLLSSPFYNHEISSSDCINRGSTSDQSALLGTLTISQTNIKRIKFGNVNLLAEGYDYYFDYIRISVRLNSQNGPEIYSSTAYNAKSISDLTIECNIENGDTLYFVVEYRISMNGFTIGTLDCEIALNERYDYSQVFSGLVFRFSDGSLGRVVQNSSAIFRDTSWSSTSPSFNTSNILSRRKGDALIDTISGLSSSFIDCDSGSITINGTAYTIDRIRKLTDSIEVIVGTTTYTINRFVDGSATGAYTSLSTTNIVPISQSAGVSVKTISPKGNNTYDLGSSTNYFREIHGGKVYGAVFN